MISKESDSFLGDIVSHEQVTGQLKVVTEIHVSEKGPYRVLLGERMGKRVILKALKEEYACDPQYLLMLRKEFEIGFSLSHPGIASVYNYQIVDGLGECIIQEYIDGETLDSFLQKGDISAYDANSILRAVTETLIYIHRKGIVHADLKPSNIIISSFDGSPKIIDFGFSDSLGYASLKFSGGTTGYIAPERIEKDYKPTPASDIWSIGEIIENVADKVKGKESRRLRKIADVCKKPLEERISSAEQLLNMLADAGHNSNRTTLAILAFAVLFAVVILLIVLFTLPDSSKENLSPTTGNIIVKLDSVSKETSGNAIVSAIPDSEDEERMESLPKSEEIHQEHGAMIEEKSSLTLITGNNEEKTGINIENEDNDMKNRFLAEAYSFARQHIAETIEDLKEKGLYRKAKTIGETWNSRYVYDEIIKEVKEYVSRMPIESEEMKAVVTNEAVTYTRELLAEEEKKLDDLSPE